MNARKHGFSTRAVHRGDGPDPATGAVIPPLSVSTTFAFDSVGKTKGGYDYARSGNPTRDALEEKIAALEEGAFGLCYSTGMAAIHGALVLLKSGDTVVAEENLYGGSHRILTRLLPRWGVSTTFVDCTDRGALEEALAAKKPAMLWLESPTNPLLKVIDIKRCAALAARHGALTVVDNTLASPYLQQPLSLGADMVVHSATKYIGGHSDALGGAIVTDREDLHRELRYFQNAVGAVPGALESFLLLRGAKTLALRMERACDNAEGVARFLRDRPEVRSVWYPGLDDHPGNALAKRQMRRFGAVVAFELEGTLATARRFIRALALFPLAVSLGAVESLIEHTWTMSHACIPPEEKRACGISPGLLRLSLGIEDLEDLTADLAQALRRIEKTERKKRS